MSADDAIVAASWDSFYRERTDVPFLRDVPDESLADWVERGRLPPGRALDVGAGVGRNSIYLARNGFTVEALDVSPEAIARSRARAAAAGVAIAFHEGAFLATDLPAGAYDLVYDGGCLHHVRPTLRAAWLARIDALLAQGGHLALTAFAPESNAVVSEVDDDRPAGSRSGWAFTLEDLRALLETRFDVLEVRRMRALPADASAMGVEFLWVALARKRWPPRGRSPIDSAAAAGLT